MIKKYIGNLLRAMRIQPHRKKTKFTGVRFRQDVLDELKGAGIAHTPQQVLSFLENLYLANKDPL